MTVTVMLLLLLLSRRATTFNCNIVNELADCGEFQITKTKEYYRLHARLQQCPFSDSCIVSKNLINCDRVCDYCKMIPMLDQASQCKNSNKKKCENNVDGFLRTYCTKITSNQCPACSTSTPPPIMPTPYIRSEPDMITAIVPATTQVYNGTESLCINVSTSDTRNQQKHNQLLTIVFGVLTGLLLVILVLVITGWVWTHWTMKLLRNKTQLCTKCRDCEEKRSYPNPTYEIIVDESAAGNATQLLNHSQTHNTFNIGNDQGHSDVRNTGNFHDSENHNHLDIHAVNGIAGEEKSGEEHMYHVLEKPGDNDYEDPDKDLEENTAMEYEIPMPLK